MAHALRQEFILQKINSGTVDVVRKKRKAIKNLLQVWKRIHRDLAT